MRYFTRGWATGDYDDAACDRALREYNERLAQIDPLLSDDLRRLSETSLNDGLIESVVWDPHQSELTLSLVVGGPEYSTLRLHYAGALLGRSEESLRRAALDREAEVLYDEIDVREDGLFVHRLLFWPREELSIWFDRLSLELTPREGTAVELGGAWHVVERDEDDADEGDDGGEASGE